MAATTAAAGAAMPTRGGMPVPAFLMPRVDAVAIVASTESGVPSVIPVAPGAGSPDDVALFWTNNGGRTWQRIYPVEDARGTKSWGFSLPPSGKPLPVHVGAYSASQDSAAIAKHRIYASVYKRDSSGNMSLPDSVQAPSIDSLVAAATAEPSGDAAGSDSDDGDAPDVGVQHLQATRFLPPAGTVLDDGSSDDDEDNEDENDNDNKDEDTKRECDDDDDAPGVAAAAKTNPAGAGSMHPGAARTATEADSPKQRATEPPRKPGPDDNSNFPLYAGAAIVVVLGVAIVAAKYFFK